jgi:excisionase family DNA binding protein
MSRPIPLLWSTGDAAKRLGVGRNKLLELLEAKRIKAIDLDGRLKFTEASLIAFINAQPNALDVKRREPCG